MKPLCAPLLVVASLVFARLALADEALARSRNCVACHALEGKRIGPSYKEIATRYAGQIGVAPKLAEKIAKGSRGAWVRELGKELLMPPNATVKPEEATKLANWILGLK